MECLLKTSPCNQFTLKLEGEIDRKTLCNREILEQGRESRKLDLLIKIQQNFRKLSIKYYASPYPSFSVFISLNKYGRSKIPF